MALTQDQSGDIPWGLHLLEQAGLQTWRPQLVTDRAYKGRSYDQRSSRSYARTLD